MRLRNCNRNRATVIFDVNRTHLGMNIGIAWGERVWKGLS